jgi:hypothetical protein
MEPLWLWTYEPFCPRATIIVAAALVSITLGVEIIFSSFFLSILSLARR